MLRRHHPPAQVVYETLLRPFTAEYEYQFLKKYALTLLPRSHLYILDAPVDDIGFLDAHVVGQFVGSTVIFGKWSERQCSDVFGDASQIYLYIGSSCTELRDARDHPLPSPDYGRWLQYCASMYARVASDPVEQIDVPARKMAYHDFQAATARLGLYRLKYPSICDLGPRS